MCVCVCIAHDVRSGSRLYVLLDVRAQRQAALQQKQREEATRSDGEKLMGGLSINVSYRRVTK